MGLYKLQTADLLTGCVEFKISQRSSITLGKTNISVTAFENGILVLFVQQCQHFLGGNTYIYLLNNRINTKALQMISKGKVVHNMDNGHE